MDAKHSRKHLCWSHFDWRLLAVVALIIAVARCAFAVYAYAEDLPSGSRGMQAPPLPPAGPLAEPRPGMQVGLPAELLANATPKDDPLTPQKVALGQRLFFESGLSVDNTVACATCHDPARAFTDGRVVSVGVRGRAGQRNSPTVLNAMFNQAQFWDGRAPTLENQASLPIVNPSEMGQPSLAAAVNAISADQAYRKAFMDAYGRPVNAQDLLGAIATYERALASFDAPFDRYIAGDPGAIGDDAKRGWELFNTKARCNKCHARSSKQRDTTLFTDFHYHNVGIAILKHDVAGAVRKAEQEIADGTLEQVDKAAIESDISVLGRFLVTRQSKDVASFKTPGLRNVMVTAPYFHDGSQLTLWDVVDHYNKGDGLTDPWLDKDIVPLALTESEIDDVVAFLASLTSAQYRELGDQELARQRELSRTSRPQRDTKRAFGPPPPRPEPPTF